MDLQASVDEKRESDFQLHSIGKDLPGIITYQMVLEENGAMKFTYISENVRELTGRTPQEIVEDPTILFDILIDEDKHRVAEAEFESMKTLSVFNVEVRSRSAGGDIRWHNLKSMPRKSVDGRIIWDGVCADITDRKRAELKLAESEKNLRNVLASIADDFYAIDRNYQIIIINENARKAIERSWGKPVCIGQNIFEIIPEKDRERLKENFKKVFEGNKIEYEVHQTKDGLPSWISVAIFPIINENGIITGAHITTKDITEGKKAEEKLRISNDRFAIIAATTFDAIWEWNLETNQLWANEMHQRLYGLTDKDPVPLVDEWKRRIHPDDCEGIESARVKALASDQDAWMSEYRFQTGDNSYKDIYDRTYVIRNAEGKPVRLMGSMMDITELKKAEAEVRNSEQRYRLLIEQASDAIMITDIEGHFKEVNTSLCEMFGYFKDELLQMNIQSLIDPLQLVDHPLRFAELKEGKHLFSHRRMLHKNGTIIDVEANIKMIPDGRVVAIARDITDRKKAEQRLKDSEEKYRTLIEQASDPILIYSLDDGRILEYNNAFMNSTGYNRKDIEDLTLSDLLFPEDMLNQPLEFGKIKKGKVVYDERRARKKDGSAIPVELTSKLMPNGNVMVIARDATERKRAEQQLIESENRLRTILNTEPECIKLLGPGGELLDMNPAGLAMIEIDDLEQVRGQKVESIVSPSYREAFHNLTEDVFNGKSGKLEFEITGLRGTKRWMSTHAVPLRDASGNIISLLSVTRDISERKKTEEELKESEERYRTLVEQATEGIFMTNEDHRYIDVNNTGCKMLGYSKEELLQLRIQDLVELNAADTPLRLRELDEGKSFLQERVLKCKDGSRIQVEINAKKMPDGNFLSFVRDITERKKAEEELRSFNERFEMIASTTHDALWEWNIKENAAWANETHQQLYGRTIKDPVPSHDEWISRIHSDDRERVIDNFEEALRSSKKIWFEEYRFQTVNGVRYIYDRTYIVRDEKGKPLRLMGSMMDITEKKNAEELLKHSLEDIRRLASHLDKIREEERIAIAREIHDELGQQLTVLKMDISWLNKNLSLTDEKQLQRMKDLLQTIDNTIKTVRRISSELRPSALDDLGLIAALEWLLRDFEKRSGVETDFNSAIKELKLDINIKTALFRVFQESLTNVGRHAQATKVNASLIEQNGDLLITIKDNGKGFDTNSIGNKKTLGILGIKERITLLKGMYRINSAPGEGTTIEIKVPVSSQTET